MVDVVWVEKALFCRPGEVLGRWMGEVVGRRSIFTRSGESSGVNEKG